MQENSEKLGLRRFWSMMGEFIPSKKFVILAVSLVLIETGLSLAVPLLTKDLVDGMDLASINITMILILISVFVLQLVMSATALYTMNFIGQKIVFSLRDKVWVQVLHLPIKFFDQNSSGETMSRITNDTLIIKDFVTNQLIPFFSGIITIVGAITLLLIIDWKMTIVMLLAVPLATFVLAPIGKSVYKVSRSLQDETASFQGDLGRVLADIRLVKSSLAEDHEKEIGHARMKKLFQFGMKEAKYESIIQPLSMSVVLLLLVAVFGYGSIRVSAGTLSAGSLVAIIFYLFQITTPFSQLANFFTSYQKARGASERLEEILSADLEPSTVESPELEDNDTAALSFNNISFSYSNERAILKNVTFKVSVGTMTAIVGPSGAGKTTLFSLIERFYLPDEGSITYNGQSICSIPLEEWRSKIAYVSQDSPIMSGTIRSNLIYGLKNVSDERIKEAIINANLAEFIDSLPNGYETEVGERGVRLSGGQRQRLAIARAMIRNPLVLLLDEATAHLDSNSEKLVQSALDKLMKNRTTLVIAHRLATVKHADQLIILENGIVTGAGTHLELSNTHSLYNELVEQQFKRNEEELFVRAN